MVNIMIFRCPNMPPQDGHGSVVAGVVEATGTCINQLKQIGTHNVEFHDTADKKQCHNGIDVANAKLYGVYIDGILAPPTIQCRVEVAV